MKKLGFSREEPSVLGIGCDIDDTVYSRSKAYFAEGSRRELEGAALVVGMRYAQFELLFQQRRAELARQLGRKTTVTETVYCLGVTPKQWSDLRVNAWQPEKWISPDPEICDLFAALAGRYAVGFGTNSPIRVAERTLEIIGILKAAPTVRIFGPENIGASKPEVRFFQGIASGLSLKPENCIFIGDRDFSDGPPAIEAGYAGAIIVSGSRDELVAIGPKLLHGQWQQIREEE